MPLSWTGPLAAASSSPVGTNVGGHVLRRTGRAGVGVGLRLLLLACKSPVNVVAAFDRGFSVCVLNGL
jgi:hypothetical protein